MTDRDHAQIQSLLGAYVLNAVSAVERLQVEQHLQMCAECAREVGLLHEASAELAWLPPPEDTGGLVDRISAALPARPRRTTVRVIAALAAVSVAAAGFLGAALVRERSRTDELSSVLADAQRNVRLTPQGGFDGQGTVYVADGRAALVLDDVPDPGRGRSYQLWAITGGKPASMTVVEDGDRVVRLFDWSGRADQFAVTIEPAGGSPVPTSDPVLVGA